MNAKELFRAKAAEVTQEAEKCYGFECPICGGYAIGIKGIKNGNIHASCSQCNVIIKE